MKTVSANIETKHIGVDRQTAYIQIRAVCTFHFLISRRQKKNSALLSRANWIRPHHHIAITLMQIYGMQEGLFIFVSFFWEKKKYNSTQFLQCVLLPLR